MAGRSRQHHSDTIRMGLLFACGMYRKDIGYAFYLSSRGVRERLKILRKILGFSTHHERYRQQLGLYFIEAGCLELMYVLMLLINAGRYDDAVALVRQCEVSGSRTVFTTDYKLAGKTIEHIVSCVQRGNIRDEESV